MKIISITLVLSCTVITSCTTTKYPYSHTAEIKYPAKGNDANIKVYNSTPSGNYEEIGVFNVDWGHKRPRTPVELLAIIEADARAAGGDFVVLDVNDYGMYVRATLYKYR